MNLKNYLIVLFILSFNYTLQAQQIDYCGYDKAIKEAEKKYPGYSEKINKNNQVAIAYANKAELRRKEVNDTVYIIPVVFHVLFKSNSENINDSLLKNQIEVLNQDYRRRNLDTSKTRSIFKSRAADLKIQFVLADKDPNGNSTTGIIKKVTTVTEFGSITFNSMKTSNTGGDDAWDPANYMNIWVCNMNYFNQPNILGYAYPPVGSPNWPSGSSASDPSYDGVVIDFRVIGRNNPLAKISTNAAIKNCLKGRTASHEVGHYLGLRHIWGDATTGNACQVDDGIDDTPLQGTKSNFDCVLGRNTCNQSNDLPDMIENYMDYSSDDCKNMLTKKQAAIIKYNLTVLRPDLATASISTKQVPDPIEDFKVYPNPSLNGELTLLAPFSYKGAFRATIYNSIGQLILDYDNTKFDYKNNEILVSKVHLNRGIYIVKFTDARNFKIKTFKIVVNGQ